MPERRVQISARIPVKLAHALKVAAVTREVNGKTPHTRQGIIEAALADWLRREGQA